MAKLVNPHHTPNKSFVPNLNVTSEVGPIRDRRLPPDPTVMAYVAVGHQEHIVAHNSSRVSRASGRDIAILSNRHTRADFQLSSLIHCPDL